MDVLPTVCTLMLFDITDVRNGDNPLRTLGEREDAGV